MKTTEIRDESSLLNCWKLGIAYLRVERTRSQAESTAAAAQASHAQRMSVSIQRNAPTKTRSNSMRHSAVMSTKACRCCRWSSKKRSAVGNSFSKILLLLRINCESAWPALLALQARAATRT